MTDSKFKIWLKNTGTMAKDCVGPFLVAIIPGIIIGGSVTALRDSRRINKLERRMEQYAAMSNENATAHNNFVDWTQDEISKLTRQNNELLERALRESEGKAS